MSGPDLPPPPAIQRLTRRPQFLAAQRGRSTAKGAVVIQALAQPDSPHIRVGFTATRKIGGAVVRNRAKRRMREAARLLLPQFGRCGFDYVFIARGGATTRPWPRLLDDVKSALISLAPNDGPRSAPSNPSADLGAAPASPPSPLSPPPAV